MAVYASTCRLRPCANVKLYMLFIFEQIESGSGSAPISTPDIIQRGNGPATCTVAAADRSNVAYTAPGAGPLAPDLRPAAIWEFLHRLPTRPLRASREHINNLIGARLRRQVQDDNARIRSISAYRSHRAIIGFDDVKTTFCGSLCVIAMVVTTIIRSSQQEINDE